MTSYFLASLDRTRGSFTEPEAFNIFLSARAIITAEMEKLINEQFCMDGNRPSLGKNPVGNAGIERQLKRTRRRDEKAGTGFVPKRKGPKRRTKGSITTEDDIVQQGASRNDANSLPLLKNLWSRVSSGMTKYFLISWRKRRERRRSRRRYGSESWRRTTTTGAWPRPRPRLQMIA